MSTYNGKSATDAVLDAFDVGETPVKCSFNWAAFRLLAVMHGNLSDDIAFVPYGLFEERHEFLLLADAMALANNSQEIG